MNLARVVGAFSMGGAFSTVGAGGGDAGATGAATGAGADGDA
jgi:hypothetical protein